MSTNPITIKPPARLPMVSPLPLPEFTFGTQNRRVTFRERMKIDKEKKKTKNLALSEKRAQSAQKIRRPKPGLK
jgi:hypothetical protein